MDTITNLLIFVSDGIHSIHHRHGGIHSIHGEGIHGRIHDHSIRVGVRIQGRIRGDSKHQPQGQPRQQQWAQPQPPSYHSGIHGHRRKGKHGGRIHGWWRLQGSGHRQDHGHSHSRHQPRARPQQTSYRSSHGEGHVHSNHVHRHDRGGRSHILGGGHSSRSRDQPQPRRIRRPTDTEQRLPRISSY